MMQAQSPITSLNSLAHALVARAKRDLAKARLEASKRPVGMQGVAMGWYAESERNKPIDDTRWSAWLVRWDGRHWKHTRRLSGPLQFEAALKRCREVAEQRGLERVE